MLLKGICEGNLGVPTEAKHLRHFNGSQEKLFIASEISWNRVEDNSQTHFAFANVWLEKLYNSCEYIYFKKLDRRSVFAHFLWNIRGMKTSLSPFLLANLKKTFHNFKSAHSALNDKLSNCSTSRVLMFFISEPRSWEVSFVKLNFLMHNRNGESSFFRTIGWEFRTVG